MFEYLYGYQYLGNTDTNTWIFLYTVTNTKNLKPIQIQKDTNTETKSLEYFSLGPQIYFSSPIRHMIQDAKMVKDTGNLKKRTA